MYRIIFNPTVGAWLIQVKTNIFFWTSVQQRGDVETFVDYDQAQAKVVKLGLDRAYSNAADAPTAEIWRGHTYVAPAVLRSGRSA